jgi:hypothetical protein
MHARHASRWSETVFTHPCPLEDPILSSTCAHSIKHECTRLKLVRCSHATRHTSGSQSARLAPIEARSSSRSATSGAYARLPSRSNASWSSYSSDFLPLRSRMGTRAERAWASRAEARRETEWVEGRVSSKGKRWVSRKRCWSTGVSFS